MRMTIRRGQPQAHHGVEVAAADADDHPQGAAQEHQSADHHHHGHQEADHGGGAAPGLELLPQEGDHRGAQNQTDDLRTDVLDDAGADLGVKAGPLEIQSPGDVPQEAGDAEAHVGRVAEVGQQHGGGAHHQTCGNEQPVAFQKAFFFHLN